MTITACETAINPFDKTRGFYSIYGAIDLRSDLNHVRVKDLNQILLTDSTRHLNAAVSLVNLDNGVTDLLEDHIVLFDSVYTHNFRIPYRVQTGTNYRLLVEGADGGTTWADVYTQEFAEVTITPDVPVYSCTEPIEFQFEPILNREDLFVTVTFQEDEGVPLSAIIPYEAGEETQRWISGYESIEDLLGYIKKVNGLCGDVVCKVGCETLADSVIYVDYKHNSPGFFEQTTRDTTSVTGGAGQFGAFYRDTLSFIVDTSDTSPTIRF